MRIVLFVDTFFAPSQTFIVRKVRALVERGESVTVVSLKYSGQETHQELLRECIGGLKFISVPEDKGTAFYRIGTWIGLLVGAMCRSPIDIIKLWKSSQKYRGIKARLKFVRKFLGLMGICGDVYHFEFGPLAVEYVDYLMSFAKPCIVSFRSDIEWFPRSDLPPEIVNKEVILHADRIHCVNKALANKVSQVCGPQKIFVNYPSVDASFFAPDAFVVRDPNLVVTVARLKTVKGLIFSLVAIANLIAEFPDLQYVIVGDGPLRKDLLYYSTDLGLQDCVMFKYQATVENIKELLQKAAIFLLPSLSEGVSNAALEAMAMQVPVISTDVGGMREAIDDGVNGFIVPRYDSVALAGRLRLLLVDQQLRKTLGENARQRIMRDFSFERQTQIYLDEYHSLLVQKSRR